MHNTEFNRAQVVKFLLWTFGLAYLIQLGAAFVANSGNLMLGRLIIAGMMVVPTLGVLLAGGSLRGLGWNPQLRRNWKSFLIAWFAPIALTAVGAALYFLVFPSHFDLSGSNLTAAVGEEALAQLEGQGLTYPLYVRKNPSQNPIYIGQYADVERYPAGEARVIENNTISRGHGTRNPIIVRGYFYEQVIIRNNMIVSAACLYQPSTKPVAGKMGLRHRAAMGISQNTDSVTIVVSEETGRISIAYDGELQVVHSNDFLRIFEEYMALTKNPDEGK